ncbi:autophagy protein 5-like [Ruditapes philippinarum]|uniref:autophagy protein 5-like n=1 Tax=Ruditapes philippinarum TaxID=129788 RepID=UPI00295BE4BE|nr:autophagy protein 5-like [Ruditapes philippinarum]XP_060572783.1 autophagy protein 5-like [Ruditapes philippinarum]
MGDDRAILRDVWEGKIPVCFHLAQDEVIAEQPEPVYQMVPRHSYLPMVTEKISKHFAQYVDKEKTGEMWIDFEGQPLKWHNPVGVLYDLYGISLPWKLTVHFQDFPEEEIIHCVGREAVESHFMSMLKEADALKHRSSVINGMQKKDHKQMWMGLVHDKFDQFWPINKRLMENTGDDMFRYIPFRIYQIDRPFIQQLLKPHSEEGHEHTLEDLLKLALPDLGESKDQKILIQGIEVPLDTPLLWLSEHFSYPDNFLHICVSTVRSQDTSREW